MEMEGAYRTNYKTSISIQQKLRVYLPFRDIIHYLSKGRKLQNLNLDFKQRILCDAALESTLYPRDNKNFRN